MRLVPAEIHPFVLSPKALCVRSGKRKERRRGDLLDVETAFGGGVHSGEVVGDFGGRVL